jgi:hypothetical protein
MKPIVLPYNLDSASSRRLANELGVKRIHPTRQTFRARSDTCIINWGRSSPYWENGVAILNRPENVANTLNKFRALKLMKEGGILTPDFTQDKNTARRWQRDGFVVFERHLLNSCGGRGIVTREPGSLIGNAQLYTKDIRKTKEYRVHIGKSGIIFVQRKVNRNDDSRMELVMNLSSYVYFRRVRDYPSWIIETAMEVNTLFGLDFCAVDIGIGVDGKAYVFEANTAPGIESQTLEAYADYFRKLMNYNWNGENINGNYYPRFTNLG